MLLYCKAVQAVIVPETMPKEAMNKMLAADILFDLW